MNSKKNICALFLYMSISVIAYSGNDKDSLGLPGDNLDLQGVLELFKKSATPEEFETVLNKEDNKVNNLDLNEDGKIDYIRVIDHAENGVHALVLQVPVNEKEAQDVAVIEIEKNKDGTAHIQIIGDEDLYGKDYIVEPVEEKEEGAPPTPPVSTVANPPVIVNVWAWPAVRYVYGPQYVVWVSPWRWSYYPIWWKPWKPYHRHVYYNRVHPFHTYHHRVYVHRAVSARKVYYGHRVVSPTVYQRRNAVMTPHHQNVKQERAVQKQQRQQAPRQRVASPNRAQPQAPKKRAPRK